MRLRQRWNKTMKTKIITRSVWILSLISLLTDVASEMLYPVMPVLIPFPNLSIVLEKNIHKG